MNELKQNLTDAGCDEARITEICRLYESGDMQSVIKKLKLYRCALMDKLHERQGEVDCLDYLLRKIEKRI